VRAPPALPKATPSPAPRGAGMRVRVDGSGETATRRHQSSKRTWRRLHPAAHPEPDEGRASRDVSSGGATAKQARKFRKDTFRRQGLTALASESRPSPSAPPRLRVNPARIRSQDPRSLPLEPEALCLKPLVSQWNENLRTGGVVATLLNHRLPAANPPGSNRWECISGIARATALASESRPCGARRLARNAIDTSKPSSEA